MPNLLLQEDNTTGFTLEDASGLLLLENMYRVGYASATVSSNSDYNVSLSGISIAQDDVIVLHAGATSSSLGAGPTFTATGDNSGAYSGAGAQADGTQPSGDRASFRMFYIKQGATPDTSIAVGGMSSAGGLTCGAAIAEVWRGADTTTALDATGTPASGNGTNSGNPPAVTPSTSGAIVLTGGWGSQSNNPVPFEPPAGMMGGISIKLDGGSAEGGILSAFAVWTSGSYDPPAWTGGVGSGVEAWAAQTIALKPAT
jgi:hypothetical protein